MRLPIWTLGMVLGVASGTASAANHREAPITALDHKADITDVYAFRSYGGEPQAKVTLIMGVDPLLDTANGPNWSPFDPDIVYELKIDNNHDAIEDIGFQFRFSTTQNLPGLFTVYAGVPGGAVAPANSPSPVPPGTPIVPDQIKTFDDPGLGQRQRYTVTMVRYVNGRARSRTVLGDELDVVPSNVGPRTMDYEALFDAATVSLNDHVKVFAGTTDDAFWIDLGGAFDTFNTSAFPVLTPQQDEAESNIAADTVSGYAVNSIAIEVPVEMLTSTGEREAATSPEATIGVWATTSRSRVTVRRSPFDTRTSGGFRQVQRMGNPLINELVIGTGFKDRFSMDVPHKDDQFAAFFLDPPIARVVNALFEGAVAIPAAPRFDLLPLVTYAPPIAAPGTPAGPIADLLRLNTGIDPIDPEVASRLGLLGGDPAGYPNGRRVFDDVVDITLRVAVGGVLNANFPGFDPEIGGRLGDGVNINDTDYRPIFPYLGSAPPGRSRRHIDPGEPDCSFNNPDPCLD